MNEVIKLVNIKKDYLIGDQEYKALRGVNISITKGEFVAIMGPSGSGKSTTMHIIGCLDVPSSGTYFLNENDVSKMTDDELAHIRNQEIGFVFQAFNLLPKLSVLENVLLPFAYSRYSPKDRMEKAMNALAVVGLTDKINNRPNQLSGGQIQRTAIARSLVMDPSIILADEPTGNLDSTTSHEVMEALKLIHEKGNTIILVTHEDDIAKYAQRIIRLKDGIVVDDEKNRKLKTK